jgi:tRNA threonylcarbamoyl adenosine modification protein YjeE
MPGAARLAGTAALRAGAGLVTVAGAAENIAAVTGATPELIYLPVSSVTSLEEALAAATVIAIGPGLGTGDWSMRLWAQVLRARRPRVVVDADALNLLALDPVKLPADWILTPHPGEAARLLGTDTAAVQADRLGAVRALGFTGAIKSPSYTLLETYESPPNQPSLTAVHLDLYRLNDPEELEHLGLADYHRPGYLWLVEWPEKAAGRLPRPDLRFQFSIDDAGHRIQRIETFIATK